jgi:hypothetical protein
MKHTCTVTRHMTFGAWSSVGLVEQNGIIVPDPVWSSLAIALTISECFGRRSADVSVIPMRKGDGKQKCRRHTPSTPQRQAGCSVWYIEGIRAGEAALLLCIVLP